MFTYDSKLFTFICRLALRHFLRVARALLWHRTTKSFAHLMNSLALYATHQFTGPLFVFLVHFCSPMLLNCSRPFLCIILCASRASCASVKSLHITASTAYGPPQFFCACIASTAYVMTHTQNSKHWECIYTPVVASTGSVRTHRIASTGSIPTLHKKIRLTPERVASFFACYGDIPMPLINIKIIYTFTTKITFLYHLSSQ